MAPPEATLTPPSPAAICADLVQLERRRVFCIRMQQRIDSGLRSALARQLGYRTDLPEKEGRAIFARVAILVRAVVADDGLAILTDAERAVVHDWIELIITTENSRLGWDEQRKGIETAMRRAAEQLPVFGWVETVLGFSALGLAAIVGEACGPEAPELGSYRSYQNLCKRLGIGVVDGKRQGAPGAGATAEDWTRHGYAPRRRSIVWAFLDDVLLRAQWRRPKTNEETGESEGGPRGVYGAIYARQLAAYEAREWTAAHATIAARRFMAKALLRDLWRNWRQYQFPEGAIDSAPQGHGSTAPQDPQPAGKSTPTVINETPAADDFNESSEASGPPPLGQPGFASW